MEQTINRPLFVTNEDSHDLTPPWAIVLVFLALASFCLLFGLSHWTELWTESELGLIGNGIVVGMMVCGLACVGFAAAFGTFHWAYTQGENDAASTSFNEGMSYMAQTVLDEAAVADCVDGSKLYAAMTNESLFPSLVSMLGDYQPAVALKRPGLLNDLRVAPIPAPAVQELNPGDPGYAEAVADALSKVVHTGDAVSSDEELQAFLDSQPLPQPTRKSVRT